MAEKTLKDLFVDELRDLYSAEKQILSALNKMAKAATSEALQEAFTEHHEQTEGQIARLEKAFELLGLNARAKKCEGIAGIIEEGSEFIKKKDLDPASRDAALIGAAQKVEHYEIASYGTVRTWARVLGHNDIAELLQQSREEEGETDEKLTALADEINAEAESEGEEEAAGATAGRGRK